MGIKVCSLDFLLIGLIRKKRTRSSAEFFGSSMIFCNGLQQFSRSFSQRVSRFFPLLFAFFTAKQMKAVLVIDNFVKLAQEKNFVALRARCFHCLKPIYLVS